LVIILIVGRDIGIGNSMGGTAPLLLLKNKFWGKVVVKIDIVTILSH